MPQSYRIKPNQRYLLWVSETWYLIASSNGSFWKHKEEEIEGKRKEEQGNFRTLSVSSKNELIAKLVLDRNKSSQKISRLLKRVAFWKAKVRSLREEIAKIKDSKVQDILDSITNPQVSFFSPFLTDISKAAEFNFSWQFSN